MTERDRQAWVRRVRRHNFWKLSWANAATAVALACFVLLLFSPAWKATLAVGVFVAAGFGVLEVLHRRDLARNRYAVEQLEAAETREFRYQAAGLVSPETARKRVATWQEQVRSWLGRAPLAGADVDTLDVVDTDTVAARLGESAANVGGRSDYAFAWSPFPGDYRRAIVRTWPEREVGSVYRTADGQVAVRWEPAGGGAGS